MHHPYKFCSRYILQELEEIRRQLEEGTGRSSAWLEVTMFVLTSAEMEQELESIVISTL